mmetsp:Transcript_13475/g.42318  ORF Transcript_13475/g.42318 Transcript_13475/m.42318 type:complete len:316 (+) Transcript_13475:210-1157(+)
MSSSLAASMGGTDGRSCVSAFMTCAYEILASRFSPRLPASSASCAAASCASDMSAARSAPVSPGTSAATRASISPSARSSARRALRPIARMISVRSTSEGKLTCRRRSRRPGRSSAGSMRSGRLVAATTTTPCSASTPSSSVSSWLTTRSVTPVESLPRRGASASNSSKKSAQGAALRAFRKSSRTAASDWPIYLFSSSGPLTEMWRRPQAAAAQRATCVLPQPGGPKSSTPVRARSGADWKSSEYCAGISSTSHSWSLTSSSPPMSSHPSDLSTDDDPPLPVPEKAAALKPSLAALKSCAVSSNCPLAGGCACR